MILSMNLKSSPGVYHYQSFTQEQMILRSESEIITRSRWFYQSFRFIVRIICSNVIYTWSDDYFNEYEIVTRCISLSIIHTGADYSINEYEITRHISSSIIHTWADDSVNEYAMTTFITVYIDYRGAGFIDLVDKK